MPGSEPVGNGRPVSHAHNTNPATVEVGTGCAGRAGAVSLDEAAIHRIVAAVQPGHAQDVDLDGLRTNLHQAWSAYRAQENNGRRVARLRRSKHAAAIARLSGELLACLDDAEHTELIQALSFNFPICEGVPVLDADWENGPGGVPMCDPEDPFRRHQEPSFNGVKAGLRKAKYIAEMESARASRKPKSEVTPLTWLIGHELVNIYKAHIPGVSPKRRWGGRSRSIEGDTPYGPFTRFVVAVCHEFGGTVSPHTVDIGIRRVRALKRRSGRDELV
jgi:hypothetical protein